MNYGILKQNSRHQRIFGRFSVFSIGFTKVFLRLLGDVASCFHSLSGSSAGRPRLPRRDPKEPWGLPDADSAAPDNIAFCALRLPGKPSIPHCFSKGFDISSRRYQKALFYKVLEPFRGKAATLSARIPWTA